MVEHHSLSFETNPGVFSSYSKVSIVSLQLKKVSHPSWKALRWVN